MPYPGYREYGRRRPPCDHPKPPCGRPKPQSVLLHKILCHERRVIPALCCDLCLTDLPRCAQPPYHLLMVQQSGAQPWWAPLESRGCRLSLSVSIPVCCQVKDACGKLYHASAIVEAETALTPCCPLNECWRNCIQIVPCVRLCAPPVCSEDACFAVRLEVTLEVYVTRPEPCALRPSAPPCPDLPLYPPPIPPHGWPQCPAAPARCEWPAQG